MLKKASSLRKVVDRSGMDAVKVLYRLEVNSVSFPRAHADDLDKDAVISVSFERGTNSIATYDRTVSTLRNSDIGVVFLESLSLVVTMYKHVASNSYQAKKGRLVIRQKKRGVLSADVYSIIGTVALDLELYVDCITGVELTLPLAECAYVGSAISFTLLPKHVEQGGDGLDISTSYPILNQSNDISRLSVTNRSSGNNVKESTASPRQRQQGMSQQPLPLTHSVSDVIESPNVLRDVPRSSLIRDSRAYRTAGGAVSLCKDTDLDSVECKRFCVTPIRPHHAASDKPEKAKPSAVDSNSIQNHADSKEPNQTLRQAYETGSTSSDPAEPELSRRMIKSMSVRYTKDTRERRISLPGTVFDTANTSCGIRPSSVQCCGRTHHSDSLSNRSGIFTDTIVHEGNLDANCAGNIHESQKAVIHTFDILEELVNALRIEHNALSSFITSFETIDLKEDNTYKCIPAIATMKHDFQESVVKVQDLMDHCTSLRNEYATYSKCVEVLVSENLKLKDEISLIRKQVNRTHADRDAKVERLHLQQEIERLQSALKGTTDELKEKNIEIDSLNRRIVGYEEAESAHSLETYYLNLGRTNLEKNNATLKSQVASLTTRLTALETKCSEIDSTKNNQGKKRLIKQSSSRSHLDTEELQYRLDLEKRNTEEAEKVFILCRELQRKVLIFLRKENRRRKHDENKLLFEKMSRVNAENEVATLKKGIEALRMELKNRDETLQSQSLALSELDEKDKSEIIEQLIGAKIEVASYALECDNQRNEIKNLKTQLQASFARVDVLEAEIASD
mmetsp:Transcript_8537/g.12743  ORF Transcript_8537/g.12743 Transcript_8537/m.12743 type:complete len:794 (+) Transcript_8537:41-2422(+)